MHQSLIAANMVLYCRQWDATIRFYRDMLQLPVLFSADWFVEFSLTPTSRLSIPDEKHASIKSCGKAGITISLQVKNLHAARKEAIKMGLKPTEIKKHPWNARVLSF